MTFGEQTFRSTKEGALAYFVGGNKNFPDDKGFALKDWGFKKDQDGKLRIILHHSSLPFVPAK